MNLYYVARQNGDFNYDWFVCANGVDEALNIWKNIEQVKDELGDRPIPDHIFLVPAIPHMDQILMGPHALEWHTEVNKVAY